MRGLNWRTGLVFLAALGAAGGLRVAAAAEVEAMRVWKGPDHTRVVFDLSSPLDYRLFELRQPERIVLDLDDTRLQPGFQAPSGQGLLADLRTGRHGKDGLRVVLDMHGEARPKSFLLKPAGDYGYRLVVDLYPRNDKHESLSKRVDQLLPGQARKVVVAVDAGHGGEDPGARGPGGTYEKNVTLAVARDLATLINAQPGMKAVLTRGGDYFIPLKKRYEIARQAKADMFVSVHADAFTSSDARGSSVWVLSPRGASSEAARWLADRQNRADLIGGVSLDDKDDTLAAVLLDLSQGATLQASNAVARNVLHALAHLGPTHRGYVEHANFVVLRSPDVPSILVETAFITNPAEERKLKSDTHRERLAKAIMSGIQNYLESTPPPGTWFAMQAHARGGEHVVSRGETLSGIAQQYGVTLNSLKSANRLSGNSLRAGAVLVIPTS